LSAFGYLLQDSNVDLNRKAFLGIGFGPRVPIDIVPLHLLGRLLPDFNLLVVDEFAKFNSHDGTEARKVEEALGRLDKIYGKTNRFRCSDFMGLQTYENILGRLKNTIEGNDELRNLASNAVPYKYRITNPDYLEYPINEVACVAFLYSEGFRLKIGPEAERKYDKLIRVLNENGRYGFRGFMHGMEFSYTLNSFSLSGKPVVPYAANESPYKPFDRIFLDDSEQETVRKLENAKETALRYLARIGCAASNILGKNYSPGDIGKSGENGLLDIATTYVIEGIIRPYKRE